MSLGAELQVLYESFDLCYVLHPPGFHRCIWNGAEI